MLKAIENFLSSNNFGKSYSEIDNEEQMTLDMQQALAATTASPTVMKAQENRLMQFKTPDKDFFNCSIDDPDAAENMKKNSENELVYNNSARDILCPSESRMSSFAIRPISTIPTQN